MKSRSLMRLLRSLIPLARNDRGNVLILTAMGLPIMLGGAGFGVDTAQWYMWKRELQTAVDAAALSGAFSLAQGFDEVARANAELARNVDVVTLKSSSVALGPWTTGGIAEPDVAVTVTASMERALPFSSMFLASPPTISARATAAIIPSGTHCMISLEEETASAIKVSGNALLELGCGIASNSRAAPAIVLEGNAQVEASPLSAVGGIQAADANLIGDSTIRPYSIEQVDPFEGITYTGSPPVRTYDKNVSQLTPGTYSGGLDLRASHTMAPGVYVIDGGPFKVNANESLTGSNITIILKNGATLEINGTANLDLTATENTSAGAPANMVGVLVFEDASTAGTTTRTSTINGNADLHLGGAIYMPTQNIQINGNSEPTTECLLLVTKTMDISGSTEIENECPPGHVFPGNVTARVARLVQ